MKPEWDYLEEFPTQAHKDWLRDMSVRTDTNTAMTVDEAIGDWYMRRDWFLVSLYAADSIQTEAQFQVWKTALDRLGTDREKNAKALGLLLREFKGLWG